MISNADDYLKQEIVGERRITPNIVLVQGLMPDPQQLILRKKRKSSRLVDFLKFQNERRFYNHLSQIDCKHMRAPELYTLIPGRALFMEYVEGTVIEDFISKEFVSAYVEFQHQEIPEDPVIDWLNQTFRGFDYKIAGVAMITMSRRESPGLAWKIMKEYKQIRAAQPELQEKYWQHGDLHHRNVLRTYDGNLYIIDFENCIFTRRWPLCEILGECIQCEENGIEFHPELFHLYWNALPGNSPIFKLDLQLQLEFAMLRKAIHVILQSKYAFRKNYYKQFLEEKLQNREFHKWSQSILAGI